MIRDEAKNEKSKNTPAFNGQNYNAQHVWTTMQVKFVKDENILFERNSNVAIPIQVFINPAVASLPAHAHLFAEDGCYLNAEGGKINHLKCGINKKGEKDEVDTPMDPTFLPLVPTKEQDEKWENLIRGSLATNANANAV